MSAVNGIHIGNGVPNEQLELSLDGKRIALFDISKPIKPPPAPGDEQKADDAVAAEQRPVAPSGSGASAASRRPLLLPAPTRRNRRKTPRTRRRRARSGKRGFPSRLDRTSSWPRSSRRITRRSKIVQQPSNTLLDPLFNGTPEVTLIAHIGSITVDGPYATTGRGTTAEPAEGLHLRADSAE
jgi:hypothetical protein